MFFSLREGNFTEFFAAFFIGAAVYPVIELMWRGYTHLSMVLLGGICMLSLHFINMSFEDCNIFLKAGLGALMITAWELLFGAVLNLALGLDVWDYSSHKFNLFGQICAPYTFLWFLLCFPAYFVSGYMHVLLGKIKSVEKKKKADNNGF